MTGYNNYKLARKTLVGTYSYINDDVSGIFPMQLYVGMTAPSGYTDVTSIEEWEYFFELNDSNLDYYRCVRNHYIKDRLQNWATMSADDKTLLIQNYVYPNGLTAGQLDTYVSEEDRYTYMQKTFDRLEYNHRSNVTSDDSVDFFYHSYSAEGHPYDRQILPYQTLVDYCCEQYGINSTGPTGASMSKYTIYPHKIVEDVKLPTDDVASINYKIGLKSGVSYTPIYHFDSSGTYSGLINKTEYYKGYVDDNNMGQLILQVEENYTIDHSDTSLNYSGRPVESRSKKWTWYKSDGSLDTENTKEKTKIYNTRRKRKAEGVRRRENIIEQLIDNVGLAGVLSGTFTDEADAHEKLTLLTEKHANEFTGWQLSGRGSLFETVENDTETTWLSATVSNTAYTQAMVPHMIGMSYSYYIQEKLKGNIS
jgi:hypothetical protein